MESRNKVEGITIPNTSVVTNPELERQWKERFEWTIYVPLTLNIVHCDTLMGFVLMMLISLDLDCMFEVVHYSCNIDPFKDDLTLIQDHLDDDFTNFEKRDDFAA